MPETSAATKKSPSKVPANAKQPQDRKPKDEGDEPLTATIADREWSVPRDALDDFELLDDLSRLDGGDASRLPAALRRLLGPEQFREAMNVLREAGGGRVHIEAGADFVADLMGALNPNS